MNKWLVKSFLIIVSIIVAVQVSGQILGFIGFYTFWSTLTLTIMLFIFVYWWINNTSNIFLINILSEENFSGQHRFLDIIGYIFGSLLIIGLLVLPLVLWPYSGINHDLTWDAGLYHLPKAAEMVVSHSTWDLTIDYGEYPWGYESLIAFSFLLSNDGMLIGVSHALILLLFAVSFFFLAARFTRLPRGLLFFIIAAIICSYDIVRGFDSNPWWIFRILAFTIGKNDFYLSALILTFLVFSPLRNLISKKDYSLPGIAIIGALIIGTKPNGALIVGSVLLIIFAFEVKGVFNSEVSIRSLVARWLGVILVLLTGLLWAIRNIVLTGHLFSQNALEIQKWSILNNITNPYFYRYMGNNFKFLLIIIGLIIIFTIFSRKFHWANLIVFLVCFFSFLATPASGFFGSNQQPTQIAWRFGAYLLAFEAVILFQIVDPLVGWLANKKFKLVEILFSLFMIGITIWSIYLNSNRIVPRTENDIVLRDIYRTSVGVDGYFSAYDYVQKKIRHSVIWVENGFPFYVFGPKLTNTVTRSKPADYWLFFKTPLIDAGGYPDSLATNQWKSDWKLIYEDSEGRVYERN